MTPKNPALDRRSFAALATLMISVALLLVGCGGGDPITHPHYDRLLITSGTPPSGTVGVPYGPAGGFSVTASRGAPPYNGSWTAASGSTLPPGLTFSALGISGQPTARGTYKVVITVTDSQAQPAHTNNTYTIDVADMAALTIISGIHRTGSREASECGGVPVSKSYFGCLLRAAGAVQMSAEEVAP